MIVTCEKCQRFYDDASCWTICPHNPLYRSADSVLCREHDLFDCKLEHIDWSKCMEDATKRPFPFWLRAWQRLTGWFG